MVQLIELVEIAGNPVEIPGETLQIAGSSHELSVVNKPDRKSPIRGLFPLRMSYNDGY